MSNIDYAKERKSMVATQLVARGVRNPAVLAAMSYVPRELFVPPELCSQAYEDRPLSIGEGQTISQPYMVAAMSEQLGLELTDRVLEIGTGSGYQAAVLSLLAQEVHTVERNPALARNAKEVLDDCNFTNIHVHVGDGTLGWEAEMPYDAIVVTAGGPRVPEALKRQLKEGGRLVCPIGDRTSQHLVRTVRQGTRFVEEIGVGCVFVPLIGEDGW
ncbi:MAG: protein-L-isoaspartate(D-aspartate) O-methyltransferase [Candidatus Hydrogenedentes bacterium]|nr:protein-L-isoaspartate(D-aspartate) O-methyltransferase [Candidatus Hydrogenedentota bacterium]